VCHQHRSFAPSRDGPRPPPTYSGLPELARIFAFDLRFGPFQGRSAAQDEPDEAIRSASAISTSAISS
jgi:hypothetical protein